MAGRQCEHCHKRLLATARADARFCGPECKVAAWRVRRAAAAALSPAQVPQVAEAVASAVTTAFLTIAREQPELLPPKLRTNLRALLGEDIT